MGVLYTYSGGFSCFYLNEMVETKLVESKTMLTYLERILCFFRQQKSFESTFWLVAMEETKLEALLLVRVDCPTVCRLKAGGGSL